jgi:sterol desaturase/sphingolipid hydroxylase (fatty acid hydroxylase superfamily)
MGNLDLSAGPLAFSHGGPIRPDNVAPSRPSTFRPRTKRSGCSTAISWNSFRACIPAIPLILYCLSSALCFTWHFGGKDSQVFVVVGFFLLGMLLWTLLEYLIHRYIFHYEPKTRVGNGSTTSFTACITIIQTTGRRLVMPPSISVPLAFLFYGMFLLIFGRFASSAFAGLVFGYVCYDMLHYATHHFPMKRGVLLWLKQYHLRHHYKDDHVGYGISSPLWDYVFRTTRK